MALIDFHCHLDLYPDPGDVAQQAADRGVYVLSVTTTPSAFLGTKRLAPSGSRIRTALGLHPELAVEREHELPLFASLLGETEYVGEVGLDGSSDHKSSLDCQGQILTKILSLCAQAGGKTISLHSRGATGLLLDILECEPLAGRAVLHWFGGSEKETARAAELGCWFSVGAQMLRSAKARKIVNEMPIERILPETDGPFGMLSGKSMYPWEAMQVVEPLAASLALAPEQLGRQLVENFRSLMGITPI